MKKNLPAVKKSASKRILVLVLACVAALALMVPAFAHGHGSGHGGGHHEETRHEENHVSLCSVENCWLSGQHVHDGVTYCGNHHAEGYCLGNCAVSPTFAMHHHGNLHGSHHH